MAIVGLEWIVVLAVVALVFLGGGKKISEFARDIGRAAGEFKKGKMEIEREIQSARDAASSEAEDVKKTAAA